MLKKGKKYYFEYPTIEVDSAPNITQKYKVNLEVIIPIDYDYRYPDDPYIIKYKIQYDNNIENCVYLIYYDKPNVRGKFKWKLENVENTYLKISDLPYSVDCSLNTFETPSKRKWFKHQNFGLSNFAYQEINWNDWSKYPLMMQDNEITLLYRIICNLIKNENPKETNFEVLKEKVSICFLKNYPYNINTELLEEYHINYLRDIMLIW